MKRTLIYCVYSLGLLFGLSYCTSDVLPEPMVPEACDSVETAYDTNIKPIIDKNCAYSGCHLDWPNIGNFTTYDGMKDLLDNGEIKKHVVDWRFDELLGMPPSYAPDDKPKDLTDEEYELFECWLLTGYPETL